MKYQWKNQVLYFYFNGDFDNLTISKMKQQCIDLIEQYQPTIVKMDFSKVEFVDSTGIGFVLARYKQLLAMESELILCNLSHRNQTLFHMSGLFQIIKHERNGVTI